MTFIQYLTNFEYDKLHCPTLKCDGQDDLGNFIHNKQPNEMQLVFKPSSHTFPLLRTHKVYILSQTHLLVEKNSF